MKSLFFVLPALLLGLTACGAPVASVTLPDTVQVEKTQTAETAVLYEDADGREINPRRAALTEWRWSVADDTIAEVDPSGIVTGLRGGSTTLTLQSADGKISASCPVQVYSPLRGIALDDYTLYFDDELVTWITARVRLRLRQPRRRSLPSSAGGHHRPPHRDLSHRRRAHRPLRRLLARPRELRHHDPDRRLRRVYSAVYRNGGQAGGIGKRKQGDVQQPLW